MYGHRMGSCVYERERKRERGGEGGGEGEREREMVGILAPLADIAH